MLISLFQGLAKMHYEMLGYFISYCLQRNYKFHIISNEDDVFFEWLSYYNNLFNIDIDYYHIDIFTPEIYDVIILVTDDDYQFKESIISEFCHKIICIDHCSDIRRNNLIYHIGTRDFGRDYAIACFEGVTPLEKKALCGDNIKIICLGTAGLSETIDYYLDIFDIETVKICIIARHIPFKNTQTLHPNIELYNNINTQQMFDLITSATHMLFLHYPFHNWEDYINFLASGGIQLAFSTGCQLILPDTWNYNFKSAIKYKYKEKLVIEKPNLLEVFEERRLLIEQRNNLFDKVIAKIQNVSTT